MYFFLSLRSQILFNGCVHSLLMENNLNIRVKLVWPALLTSIGRNMVSSWIQHPSMNTFMQLHIRSDHRESFPLTHDNKWYLFFNYYSQGQCCGLIDLMREYQNLKSAVSKVLENASNVIATRTTIKDQEDLKWALSKVIIQNIFILVDYSDLIFTYNEFSVQLVSTYRRRKFMLTNPAFFFFLEILIF